MKYRCYQEPSVIHGWFVLYNEFLVEKCAAFQLRNPFSDGIIFVFHLAGCVKRVETSQAILALLECILNGNRAQFIRFVYERL